LQLTQLRATWLILLATCVPSTLLTPACKRETPRASQAAFHPPRKPMSLHETCGYLRECHATRSYLAMRPYVDSAHYDHLIDLLTAMDELLVANAGTQMAIRQACPGIEAGRFDMSPMANHLELFSRDVEFVGQQVEGDCGTVTVQIAERLPLTRLDFKRGNAHWLYLPGRTDPEIVPVIREMADALNRITMILASGLKTEKEIEDEFHCRISPKLERIRRAGVGNNK